MDTQKHCRDCGALMAANAPQGLCPACLMKVALASRTAAGEEAQRFTPPSVEELAACFPQLEILEFIGRGGMGAVYKARQKELDRLVALKVLPPDIGQDAAFAERFAREAKALARLNHPGIVTIYDFGRADGLYFFLMEYVDGVNLRQLLAHGRVSTREALAIVPQICDALQFAHDQGFVHRDIKPENILLDRRGRVKVADFGLAKLVRDVGQAFQSADSADLPVGAGTTGLESPAHRPAGKPARQETLTGPQIIGTPNYMSPEQRSHPTEVDHRADVYALGVVFYQMLTGELPGKPLEPPSRKVLLDVRLDEVVLRALEKEPERRYQQVSEVRTAVETIANSPLPEAKTSELEQPFASLVRRHLDLVHSVAVRHTTNAQDAAAITQAVFLILARRVRSLPPRTVLSCWLYHTACLAAKEFQRAAQVDTASPGAPASLPASAQRLKRRQDAGAPSAAEAAESSPWQALAPHLDAAMCRLRSKERDVLVLRYFENQSLRQTGLALGVCDFVLGPWGPLFVWRDRTSKLPPGPVEHLVQQRSARALEKLYKRLSQLNLNATALAEMLSAHATQAAPAGLAETICATALKGSAVAPSIETLVKGTLRAMTWLKVRFAAASAAAFVLAAGAITLTAVAAGGHIKGPDISGTWEGNVPVGPTGIEKGEPTRSRIVLRLSKTNDQYVATADAIDFGRKNLPVRVEYTYASVRLRVNPQMEISGEVNAEGTELTFGDAVLHRTTTPTPVPAPLTEAEFLPRAGSDLQGYWKGTLGGPNGLPLNWKIAERTNGTYRAELDNPDEGAYGQPTQVDYHRPKVKLILASHNGMFEGELNSDHTELKGSWVQNGNPEPASFKRGDYQADRAQDARKDYSWHYETDLQGHWETAFIAQEKPVAFPVHLNLDIAKLPDGTFTATVTSIYHIINDGPRPTSAFQYSPPNLRLEWKWMRDRFEGELKQGRLVGTWIAGGAEFPVVFTRSKFTAAAPTGAQPRKGPDLQGAWEGVMHLDESGVAAGESTQTRLVLKLTKTNGTYSATADWIDWGRSDFPAGKAVYNFPWLQLVRGPNEAWNFCVSDDASEMIFSNYVHFISLDPVVLKRTTTPTPVPSRLTPAEFAPRAGSDLQGYWKGELGTNALPVDFKIAEPTAGTFRAERDNPMQGEVGRPVTVTYSGPAVTLKMASGAGMFQGKLNADHRALSGQWLQDGQSTPLVLQRADYAAEHALDAKKNYSFSSSTDLPGHWKGTWKFTFVDTPITRPLALDIAKLPNGSYTATLANVDQFGNDAPIPASDLKYDPPNLHLAWKWNGGRYDGTLENGKLVGQWEFGSGRSPVVFERSPK